MARKPLTSLPVQPPKNATPARRLRIPHGCSPDRAIQLICAVPEAAPIDTRQRRRWLESRAATQQHATAKLYAVLSAAAEIGFRFEHESA